MYMCVCMMWKGHRDAPHLHSYPARSSLLLVKTKSSIRFRYTRVQKNIALNCTKHQPSCSICTKHSPDRA